jgi:hypothetical protein
MRAIVGLVDVEPSRLVRVSSLKSVMRHCPYAIVRRGLSILWFH